MGKDISLKLDDFEYMQKEEIQEYLGTLNKQKLIEFAVDNRIPFVPCSSVNLLRIHIYEFVCNMSMYKK
ncbi:hypothetical protein D3C76_1784820 [compost metagenome]